jgi:two-component system, OmpR family, alkaline phosphatase synthesis response regulator PhoP
VTTGAKGTRSGALAPLGRHAPFRHPTDEMTQPTILICDDEESLRELIRLSLDGEYAFVEAVDGDECIAVARRELPDLVVLDLMMPRRGGLDVLREIRRDEALARTPVLVITADPALGEQARAAGASLVIVKPFTPVGLSAAVTELLGKRS